MMLLVRLLGFLLARLPETVAHGLSVGAAELLRLAAPSRWRIALSNLRHAFPEKSDGWIRKTARESARQTMEFGLLAGAMPYLTERRLRTIFSVSPEAEKLIQQKKNTGRPAVLLGPHLGPQEGHALLPLFFPDIPPLGGIYRPLDNPKLDAWVRQTRERFGIRLFSRKSALRSSLRLLRKNAWLGIFFDQNAGKNGTLITFFDRVASVTELPGILAERHDADVLLLYTARTDFWRIEFRGDDAQTETTDRETLTIRIHQWLENLLRRDESLIPNWLWLHNRWRHQRPPRFSLRAKRNLLDAQNQMLDRTSVPRKEPFFIHLPETLTETVFLLPLLRALRDSRPDVAITVIGKSDLVSLVSAFGLCEQSVPLPPGGFRNRWKFIRQLRRQFPSAHFLFSENPNHDLDARLIGAPHRFGIVFPNQRRRHLNRPWTLPEKLAIPEAHPFERWEAFSRAQQLDGEIDRTPFACGTENRGDAIGILPDKTWPLDRWRELIRQILESGRPVHLFDTKTAAPTQSLQSAFPDERIRTVPASTPLPDLAKALASCDAVIGLLSSEIHLANSVGARVICLAPPGLAHLPIFENQVHLLRSPLAEITAEQVFKAASSRDLHESQRS